MTTATAPTPRLRLPVTAKDLDGFRWLSVRVRQWITHIRRCRKGRPQGPLATNETDALLRLTHAEAAMADLTALIDPPTQHGALK